MVRPDCRGVETSAEGGDEIEAFDRALELFLNYERSAGPAVKQLLADHPTSVMGTVLRGYMLLMLESAAVRPKAAALAAAAGGGAGEEVTPADLTERERGHVAALSAWAAGDLETAWHRWDRVLMHEPLDLLALKLHHYTTFWTGRAVALRNTVEGVIDAWDDSIPGYDHLLGMYAFGLNECGRYERAEEIGRRAVAMNAEDLWSVHAVAHALEMQERHEDGTEFLAGGGWGTKNPFAGHLWWHAALFPWAQGRHDRVLELYDDRLRPASTEFYLDIQNLSSLLARLELVGVDVGDRWDELADHAAARTGDHVLAFTDVHCAMTLARTGRLDDLAGYLDSLDRHLSDRRVEGAGVVGLETAMALGRAFQADARGNPAAALDRLLPIRHDLAPIGGSLAQRNLFDLMLVELAERAGRDHQAATLLAARRRRRPRSVPTPERSDGDVARDPDGDVARDPDGASP